MNKNRLTFSLFIVLCVSIANPAFAARLSEYDGTIGSAKVKFTIVSQATSLSGGMPPGAVNGEYFYVSYLTDIPLEGEIGADREITMYELDDQHKRTAIIKGKFPETDPQHHFGAEKLGTEVIVGTWSRMDGSGSLPVYLSSQSDTFADLDHRYIGAGVQDDKVLESKAKAFRSAVLAGDKTSVVSMVNYPVTVTLKGKHQDLETPEELLKKYTLVFTAKFVKSIRDGVPHNMFSRYDGVMLGAGEVWFNADGKVKSLNN